MQKKAGVILGYLAMLIKNLSSLLLTPLMISVFGDSEFGIYKLVLSITSYFALADLGLSNAVIRYVSEYKAHNDKESESKFIALILLADSVVVSIALIALFFVSPWIPHIFRASFSSTEITTLQSLLFLLAFNAIFNLFSNLTNGVIKSYEQFGLLKSINIIALFIRFIAILSLLLLGYKSFSIVLLDTILSLLQLITTWSYCRFKLQVRAHFHNLEFSYSKTILAYSLFVFIDALAFHLFWTADNFIIGLFISSNAIAIYSVGTLISSLFFAFSIVISDVLMPGVVKQVATNATNKELTDHMIQIGRIKLIALALPTIGFIFIGKTFLRLWVGSTYLDAYPIALLVIIPTVAAGICDVGLYIMWAKNKHRIKSIVSLIIALVNIVLTVILVKRIGIIGAAIGTSFAYISGYNIFNNIYFQRVLGLDMFRFIKETLRKIWIPISVTSLVAFSITKLQSNSWTYLILATLSITLIYGITQYIIGFNTYEKNLVRNILKLK